MLKIMPKKNKFWQLADQMALLCLQDPQNFPYPQLDNKGEVLLITVFWKDLNKLWTAIIHGSQSPIKILRASHFNFQFVVPPRYFKPEAWIFA